MWLGVLFGAGIMVIAYIATQKHALSLPVALSSNPTVGGTSGVSAGQQEAASAESAGVTIATDAATGNLIGAGTAGLSALLAQLTQHSERLQDAKAENVAMQPAVAAYDADLAAIAEAYSAGQITATQAASVIATLDANIYANLHSLVGKPGTAWSNPPFNMLTQASGSQVDCNTKCTVSCCVYSDDLHSPLTAAYATLTGQQLQVGSISAFVQVTDGGFILNVPEIYPPDNSAYGDYSRPAYSLSFVQASSTSLHAIASVI
jgi:hypothetical protein